MAIEIEKMDAEKWCVFVKAEFKKLTQCKSGKLSTECRDRTGNPPSFNNDEKVDIVKRSQTRLQVEMIGRFADGIKELNMAETWDRDQFINHVNENIQPDAMLDDVIREFGLFEHPGKGAYDERAMVIRDEVDTRELTMNKAADNLVRDFCIGVRCPGDLNKVLDEFEQEDF